MPAKNLRLRVANKRHATPKRSLHFSVILYCNITCRNVVFVYFARFVQAAHVKGVQVVVLAETAKVTQRATG